MPGETFVDPLSHKHVRVHSGYLTRTRVEPSAGGYQALLDSTVLACEARVNDAVRMYLETLAGLYFFHVVLTHIFCVMKSTGSRGMICLQAWTLTYPKGFSKC